jgi:hypothetical protein
LTSAQAFRACSKNCDLWGNFSPLGAATAFDQLLLPGRGRPLLDIWAMLDLSTKKELRHNYFLSGNEQNLINPHITQRGVIMFYIDPSIYALLQSPEVLDIGWGSVVE